MCYKKTKRKFPHLKPKQTIASHLIAMYKNTENKYTKVPLVMISFLLSSTRREYETCQNQLIARVSILGESGYLGYSLSLP